MVVVALQDAADIPPRCQSSLSQSTYDGVRSISVLPSTESELGRHSPDDEHAFVTCNETALAQDVTSVLPEAQPQHIGAFLTSNDIVNPVPHEEPEVHRRSQEMFTQVCRHRGLDTRGNLAYDDSQQFWRERLVAVELLDAVRQRGIHGLHMTRVWLHSMDSGKTGTCSVQTCVGAFANLGIRLTPHQAKYLQEFFHVQGKALNVINYVRLLAHGYSNWSRTREDAVREAYTTLVASCPGSTLTLECLQRLFCPDALHGCLVPELREHSEHSFIMFQTQWNSSMVGADGVVTWSDFIDYYLDVSSSMGSDKDFCQYVCHSWGINVDDWLAKCLFQQYSGRGKEDDSLCKEEFLHMIQTLDPSISQEEGLTWFRCIDTDSSGEVSLPEFLQSQVLQAKRLFDIFDVDCHRTVGQQQMIQILRTLNSTIDEVEAVALYRYADLDGNGNVSFSEFLENHLLQMLKIFDSFNGGLHTRCITEAETKSFLRKLDLDLTAMEVQVLYRAIDWDHAGAVSFVKFVESQVLRAKLLFQRFDVGKQHALTFIKFRDLLHSLDAGFPDDEVDAIYRLVREPSDWKVHLTGFMSPNIVKLKLIFDKNDKQRRRILTSQEFSALLQELFSLSSERESEALLRIVPLSASRGVTLRDLVWHFEDLCRACDLIVKRSKVGARKSSSLARRR
mmetsp:Transcript_28111/g.64938  ORF Transcript_28111/g.64938 Transcript_28111/m.64938 type:complete len:677 (-) Transcript_28111:175-2205(-)